MCPNTEETLTDFGWRSVTGWTHSWFPPWLSCYCLGKKRKLPRRRVLLKEWLPTIRLVSLLPSRRGAGLAAPPSAADPRAPASGSGRWSRSVSRVRASRAAAPAVPPAETPRHWQKRARSVCARLTGPVTCPSSFQPPGSPLLPVKKLRAFVQNQPLCPRALRGSASLKLSAAALTSGDAGTREAVGRAGRGRVDGSGSRCWRRRGAPAAPQLCVCEGQ